MFPLSAHFHITNLSIPNSILAVLVVVAEALWAYRTLISRYSYNSDWSRKNNIINKSVGTRQRRLRIITHRPHADQSLPPKVWPATISAWRITPITKTKRHGQPMLKRTFSAFEIQT
jgi:hypothetical protein